MYKKIKRILAISMAFSTLFTTTAFATPIDLANSAQDVKNDTLNQEAGTTYYDDELTNEWSDGTIPEEVRVKVDLASQFTITIPKDIVLDGSTGKADYVVNAKGDIAGDQVLNVVPESSFNMTEAGGKTDVTATVTQNDTQYTYKEMQGNGTDYPGLVETTLTAGDWEGSFFFNIDFVGIDNGEEDDNDKKLFTLTYTEVDNDNKIIEEFDSVDDMKGISSNNPVIKTAKLKIDPTVNNDKQDLSEVFANDENLTEVDLTEVDSDYVSDTTNIIAGSDNVEKIIINHDDLEILDDLDINDNRIIVEDVDTAEHNFTDEIINPTCTEKGYIKHTCIDCGYITKDNETEAYGHDYHSTITKLATCTEEGENTFTCTYCSDTYTEIIEATGHNYYEDITYPTCTEGGFTNHICMACGDSYITNPTEPTGHDYTSEITQEPTCIEKGIITYYCNTCYDSYEEETDYYGDHSEIYGGTEEVHTKCEICDEVLSTEHVLTQKTILDVSCSEAGIIEYSCECGYKYEEIIPATGEHTYDEGSITCNQCLTNKTLEECTWAEIANISKNKMADQYFKIGDTKSMTLSNGETYNAEIIGFNHDNLADGSGKAGITFQFKEIIDAREMNDAATNVGGWEVSEMRTYVNSDVFALLPTELQAEIKIVDKVSDAGNKDKTTLIHTSDKLFLLSLEEVGLYDADDDMEYVTGQGTQYEKFTNNANRIKNYLNSDPAFSSAHWPLRSTDTFSIYEFYCVDKSGDYDWIDTDSIYGVAPAFCI